MDPPDLTQHQPIWQAEQDGYVRLRYRCRNKIRIHGVVIKHHVMTSSIEDVPDLRLTQDQPMVHTGDYQSRDHLLGKKSSLQALLAAGLDPSESDNVSHNQLSTDSTLTLPCTSINNPDTKYADLPLTLSREGSVNNSHGSTDVGSTWISRDRTTDEHSESDQTIKKEQSTGRTPCKKVKLALRENGELGLVMYDSSTDSDTSQGKDPQIRSVNTHVPEGRQTTARDSSTIQNSSQPSQTCGEDVKRERIQRKEVLTNGSLARKTGRTMERIISDTQTGPTPNTRSAVGSESSNQESAATQLKPGKPTSLPGKLKSTVTFNTSSTLPRVQTLLGNSGATSVSPKDTGIFNPGFVEEGFHALDTPGVVLPPVPSPSYLDVLHKKHWPPRNDSPSGDQPTDTGSDFTLSRRRASYKKSIDPEGDFCTSTLPVSKTIRMFGNLENLNQMFNTMPNKGSPDAKLRRLRVRDDCDVKENVSSSTFLTVPSEKATQNTKLTRKYSLSPKIIRRKIIQRLQPEQAEKTSSDSEEDSNRRKDGHQSRKKDFEIEAADACTWLKETGFPQYVQSFQDAKPIDLDAVQRDHDFLPKEQLAALFRRLRLLNKSIPMKLDINNKKSPYGAEEDEEETCVLSDKWHFERASGRWSHIDTSLPVKPGMRSCSSRDSVMTDDTGDSASPLLHTRDPLNLDIPTTATFSDDSSVSPNSPKAQREQVEKKVGRKGSFFERVGTLRRSSAQKKKQTIPSSVTISGPTLVSSPEMDERMQRLGCVDLSNPQSASDILNNNNPKTLIRSASLDYSCASCPTDSFILPPDHKLGTFPKVLEHAPHQLYSRTNSLKIPSSSSDHICHTEPSSANQESSDAISTNHIVRRGQDNSLSKLSRNRHSFYDNIESDSPPSSPTKVTEVPAVEITDSTSDQNTDDAAANPKPLSVAVKELDIMMVNLMRSIGPLYDDDIHEAYRSFATPVLDSTSDSAIVSPQSEELSSLTDDSHSLPPETPTQTPVDTPELQRSANCSASSNQVDSVSTEEESESKDNVAEAVWRERRDSGVGSSLTRESTGRKTKPRLRWHSFVSSHRPSFNSQNLHSSGLTAGQLMYLKSLALLHVTNLMEEHTPSHKSGFTMLMHKFIKKGSRTPDYNDKKVFGVPLSVVLQRTGQPLPQCILHAMRYLRKSAPDAVGIFRRPGVKSRIQNLRGDLEKDPDNSTQFDSMQAYDVADMFKQYLREMPECLLTNKLSDMFMTIYQHVPQELRLDAMQTCVLLLPDENREVLESVLYFLYDMANHSSTNQMTASNLAMCFAPSLFNIHNGSRDKSPKSNRKHAGTPDLKEFQEQKFATDCLTHMIEECKNVFKIPEDFLNKCRLSYMEVGDPAPLSLLGVGTDYNTHVDSCIHGLTKEMKDRGWAAFPLVTPVPSVDVYCKKVHDGNPLRLWKCSTEIEAPPEEVLHRVLNEQQKWNEDFSKWRVVDKLAPNVDVFHYMCSSMAPQPDRDYCVLRAWKTDLQKKGSCALITHSIDRETDSLGAGIRGIVMASRYLIEPCGSGKSKITHISRVDNRGRSAEWYNRSYGHLCANSLLKVRESFTKAHGTVNVTETRI